MESQILLSRIGKILEDKIKKSHLNIDDVTMLLREKDVFSISEVEYAILEPHGKLSVFRKFDFNNVTRKDLNIVQSSNQVLPTDIIIDGKVIKKNLMELNLDENWLKNELEKNNLCFSDINKIFYLAIQQDGTLYIDLMSNK